MKFGAIDIGSNAVRLTVAEISILPNGRQIQKVSSYRSPLRLGEEVFKKGKISKQKLNSLVQTIQAFQLLANTHEVSHLKAVATSALRAATNGKKIVQEIKQQIGLDIEIISGAQEAKLLFNAFEALQLNPQDVYTCIDVGGGSTEISVFQDQDCLASKSFEIGTLRLLENTVSKDEWQTMKEWIKAHLVSQDIRTIFGTGGNINQALKLMNPQGHSLTLKDLEELHTALKGLTIPQRILQFQLKEDRADVLVPALEIYKVVLKELDKNQISVPKIGLTHGILLALHSKYAS